MYRPKFRPLPLTTLNYRDDGSTSPPQAHSAESFPNSARTLLAMSGQEPNKSLLQSPLALRRFSLVLHSTLVVIHLLLIAIWATNLEHRLVFPFNTERNRHISLIITTISTTFGTTYAALLVFVTQTLWMRRSLQTDQTLTATHDHAAAWAGIGAAVSNVWYQKAVPASIIGVLSIFCYLGNILIFHITTPALFSLATFTSPSPIPLGTQSLPDFNRSVFNPSLINGSIGVFGSYAESLEMYAAGSLYFLPSVIGNGTNLGLSDGTLYDLIDANGGAGNVTVNATGIDVTCGYLTDVAKEFIFYDEDGIWRGSWTLNGTNRTFEIINTQRGIITTMVLDSDEIFQSAFFYSTIPIVDSNNIRGPLVNMNPPMNHSVSAVQIFQCIHTSVAQTAVVDAQSRQILAVGPELGKSVSAWRPYAGPTNILTVEDIFDTVPILYSSAPLSDIPFSVDFSNNTGEPAAFISVADL
ncbi:hypothetical protein C8R44DRAFT_787605 [Mycena epipterygia]|nr:hypothetical protein C8R44DRAFT_787605 [Mycena epipterygia]